MANRVTDKAQYVEEHIISRTRYREMFDAIIAHCEKARPLYNTLLYHTRAIHFHKKKGYDYKEDTLNFFLEAGIDPENIKYPSDILQGDGAKLIRKLPVYVDYRKALVSRFPDFTRAKHVTAVWKSFKQNTTQFYTNRQLYAKDANPPGPPKYVPPGRGVMLQVDTGIKMSWTPKGVVLDCMSDILIPTRIPKEKIRGFRFIPKRKHCKIEVVYETDYEIRDNLDTNRVLAFDPGVDNLVTITSNIEGFQPIVLKGKHLKSINQSYNYRRAKAQAELLTSGEDQSEFTRKGTKRKRSKVGRNKGKFVRSASGHLDQITFDREKKMKSFLHKASRYIIDMALEQNVGMLILGRTRNWKQNVNIGRRNNQNFVQIPHGRLYNLIKYKAKHYGIKVIEPEESYTSKASFLDWDIIPVFPKKGKDESQEDYEARRAAVRNSFSGRRDGKGYRTSTKRLIHADVNGSYNIMRKGQELLRTNSKHEYYDPTWTVISEGDLDRVLITPKTVRIDL